MPQQKTSPPSNVKTAIKTISNYAVRKDQEGEEQIQSKKRTMIKSNLTINIANHEIRQGSEKLKTITKNAYRQTRKKAKSKSCIILRELVESDDHMKTSAQNSAPLTIPMR